MISSWTVKRKASFSVMDAGEAAVWLLKRSKNINVIDPYRDVVPWVYWWRTVDEFTREGSLTSNVKVTDWNFCCSLLCLLLNHSSNQFVEGKPISICVFAGLVGDILLNNIPLRDFTIYSLDMKPSFLDRFVDFIKSNTLHITCFCL